MADCDKYIQRLSETSECVFPANTPQCVVTQAISEVQLVCDSFTEIRIAQTDTTSPQTSADPWAINSVEI